MLAEGFDWCPNPASIGAVDILAVETEFNCVNWGGVNSVYPHITTKIIGPAQASETGRVSTSQASQLLRQAHSDQQTW